MNNKLINTSVSVLALIAAHALLLSNAQAAQPSASPPLAPLSIDQSALKSGSVLPTSITTLKTTLVVTEVEGTITTPYYDNSDYVRLRGYRCEQTPTGSKLAAGSREFNFDHCLTYETNLNKSATASIPLTAVLVAPTLEISPGNNLEITVKNQLSANSDDACSNPSADINTPHCFNNTNLHTHGLWVDPDTEDDVLTSIKPQESKTYHYNIRNDHPAGTFWYHPHVHGSTAIQVGSGMVGALIIRGDRKPIELKTEAISSDDKHSPISPESVEDIRIQRGDLDTLLNPFCRPGPLGEAGCKDGKIARTADIPVDEVPIIEERTLLFQQIQYYCGELTTEQKPPQCTVSNPGTIANYDKLGPSGWKDSKRHTSINGIVVPTYKTTTNTLQRLRMIHGGVRDTLNVQVYKLKAEKNKLALTGKLDTGIAEDLQKQFIDGVALSQYMVATDGLTLPYIIEQNQTVLQPGYRADVLLNFDQAGVYVVFDGKTPPDGSVNQAAPDRQVLAFFEVGSADVNSTQQATETEKQFKTPREFLRNTLITLANKRFTGKIKDKVVYDLKSAAGVMSLDSFTAHQPITESQLTSTTVRKVEFNIDTNSTPAKFEINNEAFSGKKVDQLLKLGDVEEWHLTSKLAGHPFHIHVNPFEIIAVYNPQGIDVSAPRQPKDQTYQLKDGQSGVALELKFSTSNEDDLQYANLKGAFKDTIFVKPGYTVVVRSHYKRFDGDFVLHCHILDHEDQGMMQYVRIWGGKNNPTPDSPLRGSHVSHTNHHSH